MCASFLPKVAKERPEDPVQYVADYLHDLNSNNNESAKISPSHPNKQTMNELDKTFSKGFDLESSDPPQKTGENGEENGEENGLNGHHSRLDDFEVID